MQQEGQIGRGNDCHGGGVQIWCESHAGQCCIAAIRASSDADTFGTDPALRDEILNAPSQVILHSTSPLTVTGVEKFLTVPGRTTEIRLHDSVAAICKELSEGVIAPVVASPWAPVRKHDQG